MAARFERIERDQPQPGQGQDILHEALVERRIGEGRAQSIAVIVVADHQVDRERQVGQHFRQPRIAGRIAEFGEIAREQQQVGAIGAIAQPIERRA